jgi:adenylate cyclase
MPGVEILAQLVEQMLRGQLLSRPDWVIGAEFLAALAAGAVIVVAASFGRIWGSSAGAVAILLTAGLCVIGYTHLHLLIDPLRPALMLAMATVGAVLIQQPPRNGGQPA